MWRTRNCGYCLTLSLFGAKSSARALERFLASSLFRYLVFPLGNIVFGVVVKYVTRNDQYSKFSKEDIAVGLDMIRTALFIYLLILSDRSAILLSASRNLEAAMGKSPLDAAEVARLQATIQGASAQVSLGGWILFAIFLCLWGTSTLVRKWGWDSATELRPVRGIALPLIIGVLTLVAVMPSAIS